jgi:hypothetical protein
MCLPISRLFWVSSLAYPNLLGIKGYVVVVVVVSCASSLNFDCFGVSVIGKVKDFLGEIARANQKVQLDAQVQF